MNWRQPLECGRSGYCWQTPIAPEGRGILAGGGAKRSHRKRHDRTTRPERAPDRDWSCCEFRSVVPAGTRTIFFDMSRWLRFAPPPANFRRPSGAGRKITSRSLPAVSLGTALVVLLDFTDSRDEGPEWDPSLISAAKSRLTTKAVPSNGAPKPPPIYALASSKMIVRTTISE